MASTSLPDLVDLLKALAHPVRLRILALLREGELCVCQVRALTGQPTSTVSEHLSELRRAGLLEERRDGKWVYYALRPQPAEEALLQALWPKLLGAGQVVQDLAASAEVRKIPVETTCRTSKACARPASRPARAGTMEIQP